MRIAIDCRITGVRSNSKFTPLSISNTKLWLSADKGITLNGSKVSAWADQSGNGNHFTQGTGSNQPTFLSNAVNNKPAVKFEFTYGTYMRRNAFFGSSNESSLIVVLKPYTGRNDNIIFGHSKISAPYNGISMSFDGGSAQAGGIGRYNGGWVYCSNKISFSSFNVAGIYGLKDATSGYLKAGVNGNALQTIISGNTTVLDAVTGNSFCDLGRDAWGGVNANFDLCELVLYDKLLSDAERSALVGYLKTKYGIV